MDTWNAEALTLGKKQYWIDDNCITVMLMNTLRLLGFLSSCFLFCQYIEDCSMNCNSLLISELKSLSCPERDNSKQF